MLFSTVAALLLPAITMALPAQNPATAWDTATENTCVPLFYILTEYTLTVSPNYNYVSFNVQSTYTADSPNHDAVEAGANCEADGVEISSKVNKCNFKGLRTDKLVFFRKGRSDEAKYRLHHEWECDGDTWVTDNDLFFPPLDCQTTDNDKDGKVTECTIRPLMFQPQDARKIHVNAEKVHSDKKVHDGKKYHGNKTTHEDKKAYSNEKARKDKAKAAENAAPPVHNML